MINGNNIINNPKIDSCILSQMDKPFLVDIPVRVNIWIRPECQRMQFEILKKARPSIIFLQSDGGRNEQEWDAIYQNRRLFEEDVDWNCTIYRFFENHNIGLYTMGKKVADFIWSKVDRCIFLEDDQVPSVSFFRYCAEMLEQYKDDLRIECICGMNQLEVSTQVTSDYFFAREGSIWGTATWRDRVMDHDHNHSYSQDPYIMHLLESNTKSHPSLWERIKGYANNPHFEGHVAGTEFFRMFSTYSQSRFYIVPKYNMINNIGCDDNAAHTHNFFLMSDGYQKLFNMKTYEIEFPLKHAKYVIPDEEYSNKVHKILNIDITRFERFKLRLSICWRLLRHGGITLLIKGIITRLKMKRVKNET